ncbi:hypothetical protein MAUB1S_03932 [Mycolicibacterium aubagnense]
MESGTRAITSQTRDEGRLAYGLARRGCDARSKNILYAIY